MDALEMGLKASANAVKEVVKAFDNGLLGVKRFNFKSQICTDRNQSERLLALSLKKETADMVHFFSQSLAQDWTIVPLAENETARYIQGLEIPAWSLHRLIEMMPPSIRKYNDIADLSISNELVQYHFYDVDYNHDICLEHFNDGNIYDNIIDCIEWLIKEGYFNKEYWEENHESATE